MTRSHRAALVLVATAILGSCADPVSPLLGARYALESIGGDALPTNSVVNGDVLVVADTLTILEVSGSSGRAEHRQTAQLTLPEPAVITSVFEEEFSRAGDVIAFLPRICAANENCLFIPHQARIDGDELVLSYNSDIIRTQRYRRVN